MGSSRGGASAVLGAVLLLVCPAAGAQDSEPASAPPAVRAAVERALPAFAVEALAIPDPPAGTWGVQAGGTGGGALFTEADGIAEAWLGAEGGGIWAWGSGFGGYFADADGSGYAAIGFGDYGVVGYGADAGGYFADSDGSAFAHVGANGSGIYAWGSIGVYGQGTDQGGFFVEGEGDSMGWLAHGGTGVEGVGTFRGGAFADIDGSGFASLGIGDIGITANGSLSGGSFRLVDQSAWAGAALHRSVGTDAGGTANPGSYGLYAGGAPAGGYFQSLDGASYAYIGGSVSGPYGIWAVGSLAGGFFRAENASGIASLGESGRGVYAYGTNTGGSFFTQGATTSIAAHQTGGALGISARGDLAGGSFYDETSGSWTRVGYSGSKVYGTGSVSFVQNHPTDPGAVIVYAAPEGDEVATYTRGTARLGGGEARVRLGETFQWVTNPDLGLTAYVTPVGDWCDLYVAEKATDVLLVRSRDGTDCTFDYMVYGLRIGFEVSAVVQEKSEEAFIPSMDDHRELLARRPELVRYTARERFTAERAALGVAKLDTSRADALVAAIHEFDPDIDRTVEDPGFQQPEHIPARPMADHAPGQAAEAPVATAPPLRPGAPSDRPSAPMEPVEDLRARSFRPEAGDLSTLVEVEAPVEPGDVLVIGPDGRARRSESASAPTVLGVVAETPGVLLGDDGAAAGRAPLAFSGIARCKVDATFGPIYPGDLLVTSPTPGHAMRADVPAPGTVLAKALEEYSGGTGTIRVLVMLR